MNQPPVEQPLRRLAYDRRQAAMREAGHFVIGRHVGLKTGDAWIAPYFREPYGDYKFFVGMHGVIDWEVRRLSEIRRMMVAVACFIGERVWATRFDYGFRQSGTWRNF